MAESPPPPPPLDRGSALLLDFDGTLVELAETPDSIAVPDGLPRLLDSLAARLDGRVALVSGRSISDLERHAGPLAIAVSGSHGFELRKAGGAVPAAEAPEGLAVARDEAARFAEQNPGILLEEKPAGVALHYRQEPESGPAALAFMAELARRTSLRLQPGNMVAELVPAGADKGEAVRRLMREPPFAGARPVFVGDDLTDEHGFEAAASLGGGGILVGPARPTAARWRLDGVEAVGRWLRAAAEA